MPRQARKAPLLLAVVLCGATIVQSALAAGSQAMGASAFIKQMGDRAVAALAMQGDPRRRDEAFAHLLIDAIDFRALGTASLGRMARTASVADKREFTQLFATRIIDLAIDKFGDLQILRFAVAEAKPLPSGGFTVHTVIDRAGGPPLVVDWHVRDADGKLKINDIEVEGYSLMIHYRGEFERANVSTVRGVIDKLRGLTANSPVLAVVRREMLLP